MITVERLEELIKQGGTVYYMSTAGMLKEIKVEPLKNTLNCDWVRRNLDRFYETKESLLHSQWHRKIDAERTERFEPPMWEEIDNLYDFCFCHDNAVYSFQVKKNFYIEISCKNSKIIFVANGLSATKENYIKACEIVRDLFNRGNK